MVNKLNFQLFISVLVLSLYIIEPVKCKDKECQTIDGKPYVCVVVTECKEIMLSIFRWPRPLPEDVLKELRSLVCGYQGELPKICCRPQPKLIHKNIQLLSDQDCGISSGKRIMGGTNADLFEFPWMASLAYKTKLGKIEFQCGGSIISKRYVLTAAHCISEKLVEVRLGEHNIETELDCFPFMNTTYCAPPVQDMQIEETIMHEDYQLKDVHHDIALIRLKTNIDFAPPNVMSVCLPIYEDLLNDTLEGRDAVVTGWGASELQDFKPSPVLLKLHLDVISNDKCKALYRSSVRDPVSHITKNKFCAGIQDKDSCRGDSGGPMVVIASYEGRPRYIQYGIVSYGHRVCGTGIPGVYTRIPMYMEWILNNLKP